MAKRMLEDTKSKKGRIIFNIIVAIIFLLLIAGIFYISPNYVKEDREGKIGILINNNDVTLSMKKDIYKDENNNIYLSREDVKNYFDKYINYDEETGEIITTSEINIARMHVGSNDISINGVEDTLNSQVLEKNDTIYIPFSEISEKVYDVNLNYIESTDTIVIDSLDRKQEKATITKNTNLKYKTTGFSRTLSKLKEGDEVIYIQDVEDWTQVRTKDGIIGYVKNDVLGKKETVREDKEYVKKVDGKVNLVWDYYSEYVNAPDRTNQTIDGVNVVSPAFFSLETGSNGEIFDNCNEEGIRYIEWAHNNGYQVWAMFSNNSLRDTTSNILNDYEKREYMIQNLLNLAEKYNIDGINVDFENMNGEDKDLYSRFLIELSPQLRRAGKTLSVDVTAPDGSETWSLCFDRDTIADVSDYIIFMAYDQHGPSSKKAGTVAGYNWVETNIKKFLGQEDVDAEKLILGIPLYTRLWKETNGEVESDVVNMKDIQSEVPEGLVANWDDELKQYYAEYEENGSTYKIWVENEKSVQEKIKLANNYKLAGIAFWEKDRETNDEFWTMVKEELNK